MTMRAVAALALLTTGALACDILSPGYETAVTTAPASTHILRGDTVSLHTCYEFSACNVVVPSGVYVRWAVRDPGVVTLVNQATPAELTLSVVVRGVAPGRAEVSATRPKGSTTFSVVNVADSSAITRLEMVGLPESLTVKGQALISVWLKDSAGTPYRALPTSWSVNDSGCVRLTQFPNLRGTLDLLATARTPGFATVTVTFLDLTTTHTLRVAP